MASLGRPTILLESIHHDSWTSDFIAGPSFINAPTGVIDVQAGAGGGANVYGSWVNEGTIDVETGAALFLQPAGGAGPDFTQAGGTLNAGAGYVAQIGGVFHYTGGALGGTFVTAGVELDVEDATGTGLIQARGQNQLDQNLAPGVTLWVQGSDWNGDAALTVAPAAVNAGVILLESIGSAHNSNLVVAGGAFTNAGTGVIDVQAGSGGGRNIYGSWVNDGTVEAEAGVGLFLQASGGAGPDVTLAGGTLNAGAGYVAQIGGVFDYTGGALGGECITFDAELDITDATGTGLIEVRGMDDPFDDNLSPGVTLWVQGCDWNGNATLIAAADAVNAGTILLESLHHDFWSSDLVVAGDGTLTNTATGVITAQAGAGGGRLFQGNLVNQGALTVDTAMQWVGAVANSGTIAIAAGVEVDPTGLDGAAPAFSQTGGSLTVNGALVLDGGTLDVEGGALDGGGTLRVQNARLSFGADAGGLLPVQVVGAGNVLLDNLGSVGLWVRGDDLFGNAVLTAGPGAVNAGTILLQSASSWWGSYLAVTDELDNTAAGLIHVAHGAGGGRSITGDLSNEGTVLVDADASVQIYADALTQNDGVIEANGQVTLSGGLLDFEGGAITGDFYAENAQIYVSPDVADPSVVHVVGGGDMLLDNASASTTLLVQGNDASNAGVLTVAPDATNAGVIQLDSASAYWGSALVLQDMLDNTPTGSILVTPGAGGGRAIVGDIDNEGLLSVAAGMAVEIVGAAAAGPTFIQDGGTIQADGRLVLDGGLLDIESGNVNGSFSVHNSQIYVGPGAADAATVYVVGSGNTLLGNEGPSVTLQVEGDDAYGQGVLTAAAGAVNAGSIVGSTSTYWGSALAAPDTLLNASGGLIAVADDGGGGSRSLVGDFLNAGTISVPQNYQLSLDGVSDAGPTLIQAGGLISAGGSIVQHGGLFDFESGQVGGDFAVDGARIYVGPDVTAASGVQVVGPNNVLLDNASLATTLWVRGDDAFGQAVLTAAPGAGNSGTILLASVSSYWESVLAAPDGFVNRAGAQIAAYGGNGVPALTGTVTNDGYLSLSGVAAMHLDALVNDGVVGVDATGRSAAPGVEALADLGAAGWAAAVPGGDATAAGGPDGAEAVTHLSVGSWTNNGVIGVDPGTQLEVAPDGSGGDTFTQAGGLVAAAGALVVDGGLFHYTGGGLSGAFAVRDGWIRVESSVVVPSVVDVVGHANTLLDNASAAVTLDVQGGSPLGDGDAVLTAADASTNRGTILLESLDGVHHGYLRVPEGTFTNEAGGAIRVNLPAGDAGPGSITAARLEDDGGIADTTGLAVTAALQPGLQYSPCNCTDDGGSSGGGDGTGSGGEQGGSLVETDAQASQARQAQTPGVSDGVVVVGDVGAGPDATGLPYSCDCGWTPPGGDSGGSSDGTTTALLGSLYNLGQVVIGPVTAAGGLINGFESALAQAGNLTADAGWGVLGLASVGAHALLGTPGFNPTPQSAFLKAAESAGDHGQLTAFLGQTVASTVWNVATLPGRAYAAAGPAFATFASTGNLGPLLQWGGSYGAALAGLATGAVGLVEGGAGLLSAADAGALAAEAAGVPAWVGVAQAFGASEGLIAFLGDESGALNLNVLFGLGGEEEAAAGAVTDPVQVAQDGMTQAVTGAEATAQEAAAGGDAADAGQLAKAEVAAAQDEAATLATGADAAAVAETASATVEQAQQTCQTNQGSTGGCFAAETQVWTCFGLKAVALIRQGDRLLSRSQDDPEGLVEERLVVAAYKRIAPIWEMRLGGGRVIRATGEHPFWVKGKGQRTTAQLELGDELAGKDGEWTPVESVTNTRRVETVYNVTVAEHHTYFVGGTGWDFAVWAHNYGGETEEIYTSEPSLDDAEVNSDAVRNWSEQFDSRPAQGPADAEWLQFQQETVGSVEYHVGEGDSQIWADGINYQEGLLQEVKYVANPASSRYIPDSAMNPEAIAQADEKLNAQLEEYAEIIQDRNNPIRGLEIVTNNTQAAAYFAQKMQEFGIPGRVTVVQWGPFSVDGVPL